MYNVWLARGQIQALRTLGHTSCGLRTRVHVRCSLVGQWWWRARLQKFILRR